MIVKVNIKFGVTLVLEKTLESPLDCQEIQQSILRRSVLGVHWED